MRTNFKTLSILVFVFFTLLGTQKSFSQSLDNFFKYEAVELLAQLAHPSNDYERGTYTINNGYVLVNIYYKKYTTRLKVYRNGNYFTDIEVLYDNDYVTPFTATTLFKKVADLNDKDYSSCRNNFQILFEKATKKMSGKELACFVLTLTIHNY